jgi:hypothetical protein
MIMRGYVAFKKRYLSYGTGLILLIAAVTVGWVGKIPVK